MARSCRSASAGAAYTVQGIRSISVPGKWACGGVGPGVELPEERPAGLRLEHAAAGRLEDQGARQHALEGRWQWDYAATSAILRGSVKTTIVLDATTGRLISGSRTDPTGTTRYTFSYTTIFAPVALP